MRRFLPAFALMALAAPAAANDSIAELSTGGLVLTDSAEIEMAREDLRISPEAVAVDYVFRNRTPRDIAATVAFPMPEVGGDPGRMTAIPAAGENFLDFTVTQDGRPIRPALSARAFVGDRDVTATLAAAHVPVIAIPGEDGQPLAAVPAPTLAEWEREGLIRFEEYGDDKGWHREPVPLWTARSSWHWQTTFPAGAEVRVAHRYRPSLGGSAGLNFIDYDRMQVGGEAAADYRRRYCMDADFESAVNRVLARVGQGMVPMERRLSYVLGTGGNWAGGRIGEFTLTVDKGSPDALVSFCGKGVERTGPTTFRMKARDFAPPPMLEILIVTPAGG